MAKHRIRRWFQFGVLDLLVLVTAAAVVVMLWRPVQTDVHRARPWIAGAWGDKNREYLWLFPDGWFDWGYRTSGVSNPNHRWGHWTLVRLNSPADAFVLQCDEMKWLVSIEPGSDIIEALDESGNKLGAGFVQHIRLEGSLRGGGPTECGG